MKETKYENVSMNLGRKGNADMSDVENMKRKSLAWFFDGGSQYYFVVESDEGDSSILDAMRHQNGAAWHIRSNEVFAELAALDDGDRNYLTVTMVCHFVNDIDAEQASDDEEGEGDVKIDNRNDSSDYINFNDIVSGCALNDVLMPVKTELSFDEVRNYPNASVGYGELRDLSNWHNTGELGYHTAYINGIKSRSIPGYTGLWAGEDGSIWSQLSYQGNGAKVRRGERVDAMEGSPVRKLKPQHCMGYDVISYPRIGRAYGSNHVYVHRLIYIAWVDANIDGRVVSHLDGVASNNAPDNLCVAVNRSYH